MNIKECIDIVDNIKPNQYTIKDKVSWLSFIDGIIINEVLKTHEGYDGRYDDFEGYSEDKLSVPLIVPSPYDRLYTAYLKMKIDSENGETARYNKSAALYNTYMMEYKKHYNKTHMPLDSTSKKPVMPSKTTSNGLSDAEYENIKRDLTYILTEYFSNTISKDKVYAVVNEFIQNNTELITGRVDQKVTEAFSKYLEENPITVTETDPTVPDWAKQPTKPKYTVDEVEIQDGVPLRAEIASINRALDDRVNYGTFYVEAPIFAQMVVNDSDLSEKFATNKNRNTIVGAIAENRQNISTLETDIDGLQKQINEESHFRGYLSTNAKIQVLEATPNDFAYSAESGTKWVYDATDGWVNTETPVPDQLTPASNSTPKMSGEASAGTEEAYARGDHRHPSDNTKADKADTYTKTDVDNIAKSKLSETVITKVVDTPVWSTQPTVDGELLGDFKTTDFYYVTLRDTDGSKLPDGQFKLMPYVDKYAEAYEQIFYRSTVPSENFPVDFKEVGASFKMRDAGQSSVSFDIGKKFKDINRLELSAVGHYIQQRGGADYFAPHFTMSQKCRSYSNSTATWDYDSNTMIWHYTALNGTGYKANWFRDSFYLQKNGTNTFTSSRKCSLRCVAYGGSTVEKKGCNTVGYGWVPSEDTIVYGVTLTTIGTSGFIRNGTEITVKEVK